MGLEIRRYRHHPQIFNTRHFEMEDLIRRWHSGTAPSPNISKTRPSTAKKQYSLVVVPALEKKRRYYRSSEKFISRTNGSSHEDTAEMRFDCRRTTSLRFF